MSKYKIITPISGFIIEYAEADSYEEALEKAKEGEILDKETEYDIDNFDYELSDVTCED